MDTTKIEIDALIKANKKEVWDCYTAPEHITRWNFASDDWTCPSASNDLKVGGKYVARMEAKDGSMGFDFEAVYSEVKEHEKLAYDLTDGRRVTVLFEPFDDQTKVSVSFDAETENSVEMQRNGWQAILNNFKIYVESK